MSDEPLVPPKEAAQQLGVAVGTLARWRREGWVTPAEVTAGGQARYRMSELREQVRALQRRYD
ncbi:MerR family transcriptional regulator [Amycolatopsis thermoflava]|uniref:MerR family transcriptional regulator n=1 Tax=Amycolatopsis thermoflava TaxID=84480 RepID=UPI003F4A385F